MIEKKLDELSELYAQRDLAMLDKTKLIEEAMPAEVKARIAEIEAEFGGKIETVNEKIGALEEQVKDEVKKSGASVKGQFLHAVYAKGRITWDTKGTLRKEGEASVSLRKI